MFTSLPPIHQIAADLRAHRYSIRDLAEFCLSRIERLERLHHAWVLADVDGVRHAADRLGDELRAGRDRGLLHGIPVGIKDLIDVAGWPTRAGSPLRRDHVAEHDAPVIAQLRAAGALIMGKTVTTEFACFDPPPTLNPWNRNRTPGGSSSGSAVAVALGMCVAALGSQTGGSIIRPASFCGVAGLKPTFGRVSTKDVVPVTEHLDHVGPIARCVDDLRILWNAIRDPASPPPTATFSAARAEPSTNLVRWREYFETESDAQVREVTERAMQHLAQSGIGVGEGRVPASFEEVHARHRCVMAVEAADYHRVSFADHAESYGPRVASLLREGLAASALDYLAARRHQQKFRHDMQTLLASGTILAMPSTCTPAPGIDSTGDPKFNSPWSFAGLPSVTIPCGLSEDGLPCGLQLVAAADHEAALLDTAQRCEQILAFAPFAG